MSIEKLKMILKPPLDPEETGAQSWEEVEQQLGKPLPSDYKSFVETFGTGSIGDFIIVFNPFSSNRFINLVERGRKDLEGLAGLREQFPTLYKHERFPSPTGLLPFGSTDNGEIMYWRTVGHPDKWTVVVYESRGPRFCEFDGSMSDFLSGVIDRSVNCDVFPRSFPGDAVSFVPLKSG